MVGRGFARLQSARLRLLLQHAAAHTTQLPQRLRSAGLTVADIDRVDTLPHLPLLPRRTLQQQAHRCWPMCCARAWPHRRGQKTSGSTGEPVSVTRTAINQLMWLAFTLREHLWQERDFSGRLAAIRANLAGTGPVCTPDWGQPVNLLYRSGPGFALPINTPINAQMAWLSAVQPHYLLTIPTIWRLCWMSPSAAPSARCARYARWAKP